MVKYGDGQQVVISKKAGSIPSRINFNQSMTEFLGQKVTIKSSHTLGDECYYEVKENDWSWAEAWLEEIVSANKRESPTYGMVEIDVPPHGSKKLVDTSNIFGYCGGDVVMVENRSSIWQNKKCIVGGSDEDTGIWHKPIKEEGVYLYGRKDEKQYLILLERQGLAFKVGDVLPDGREILVINPHTEEYYVSDPGSDLMDESMADEEWWPRKYRGGNVPHGQWLSGEAISNGGTDPGTLVPSLPLSGMIRGDDDLKKIALIFLSRFNDAMRRGHTIIVPLQDCIISEGPEDPAGNRISVESSDGNVKHLFFRVEEKHMNSKDSLRLLGVTLYHLASGRSEINDESFIAEGYEKKPLASKVWPVMRNLLRGKENKADRSEEMLLRIR